MFGFNEKLCFCYYATSLPVSTCTPKSLVWLLLRNLWEKDALKVNFPHASALSKAERERRGKKPLEMQLIKQKVGDEWRHRGHFFVVSAAFRYLQQCFLQFHCVEVIKCDYFWEILTAQKHSIVAENGFKRELLSVLKVFWAIISQRTVVWVKNCVLLETARAKKNLRNYHLTTQHARNYFLKRKT